MSPWALLLTVVGGVACGLAIVVSALIGPVEGTRVPDDTRTVVVMPGQSLSAIAEVNAPNSVRQDVVARIVQLNSLNATGVAAGQQIVVPVDWDATGGQGVPAR